MMRRRNLMAQKTGYSLDSYVHDRIVSFADAEWGLDGSKFYNMMVHKRALTNEELAQNYEVDRARFGITEVS